MTCATLFQCFNFLARHNGRISLASDPENPCKNRCVVAVDGEKDEVLAAIEYDIVEEIDFLGKVLSPVCRALQEQVEDS